MIFANFLPGITLECHSILGQDMSTPDQESEALADKQVAPDLKQNGDLNKSFIFCSFNLSLHCAAVQEHYNGPCRAQDHPRAEGY